MVGKGEFLDLVSAWSAMVSFLVSDPGSRVKNMVSNIARSGVPHAGKSGRTLGTFCTES
jgi:hypothetical protein